MNASHKQFFTEVAFIEFSVDVSCFVEAVGAVLPIFCGLGNWLGNLWMCGAKDLESGWWRW